MGAKNYTKKVPCVIKSLKPTKLSLKPNRKRWKRKWRLVTGCTSPKLPKWNRITKNSLEKFKKLVKLRLKTIAGTGREPPALTKRLFKTSSGPLRENNVNSNFAR